MRIQKIFVFFLVCSFFGAGCDGSQVASRVASDVATQTVKGEVPRGSDNLRLEETVRQVFEDVDAKRYPQAYGHFSDAYKKNNPFSSWSQGYEDTLGHAITSLACENWACVVDFTATEITKESLRRQRYVLKYVFVTDSSEVPLIDGGTALSNETVEVVTSFVPPKQVEAVAPLNHVPEVAPIVPAPTPIPVPAPAPPSVPAALPVPSEPQRFCCKYCTTGKACGDSCISRKYTCHKAPGCACDG